MLRWETESGDVKTNQTVYHCTHVHPSIPGKVCSLMGGHESIAISLLRGVGVFQLSQLT